MTSGQNRITVGYCRVSSPKQKKDLQRQEGNVKTYMLAMGNQFEIVTDAGSGINYNNTGLNKIIAMGTDNRVDKIVVLYMDRLIGFDFELIEDLCKKHDILIEVIDYTEKTEEQELVEDFVQIFTVFNCRLHGKCIDKARKMIRELIQNDAD